MGDISAPKPVLLVLPAFSASPATLQWALQRATEKWGPPVLESEYFSFDQTNYYEREMGAELKKVIWAFPQLVDPAELAAIKHLTNDWEQQAASREKAGSQEEEAAVARPLNLDPGLLSEAKLVLATTKDRDHRIYLGQGIFAEVTLYYRKGAWRSRDWTYADYQRPEYHQFFMRCRDYLRQVGRSKR